MKHQAFPVVPTFSCLLRRFGDLGDSAVKRANKTSPLDTEAAEMALRSSSQITTAFPNGNSSLPDGIYQL
jgi:hypothetical protein